MAEIGAEPDLGPCSRAPDGCAGRLVALISDDGSAWEAEACLACCCTWWNSPPKRPPVGVASARQSDLDAVRAKRDADRAAVKA